MSKCKWILTALVFVSVTLVGNAQDFEGKDGKYNRKGYEIVSEVMVDSSIIIDPVTEIRMLRQGGPMRWLTPVKLNGEKIYRYATVTKYAEQRRHKEPLEDYILTKVAKRLKVIPDGSYRIKMDNVVVNKNGEIVYYELSGLVEFDDRPYHHEEKPVASNIKQPIDNEVRAIMNSAPSMKPAKLYGKKVAYLADVDLSQFRIDVKNNEVEFLFRQ